jgi:hypothetical protein
MKISAGLSHINMHHSRNNIVVFVHAFCAIIVAAYALEHRQQQNQQQKIVADGTRYLQADQ